MNCKLITIHTVNDHNYIQPLTLLIGWPWPKYPQSYSDTLAIRRAQITFQAVVKETRERQERENKARLWELQGDILGSQAL